MTRQETQTKKPIASRFDEKALYAIEKFRGTRTQTEFVRDIVLSKLEELQTADLIARRKKTLLCTKCKHRYDVLESKNDVFLLCKKCHTSQKLSKAEFEQKLSAPSALDAENQEQPEAKIHFLPDETPSNQTQEAPKI